MKRKTFRQSIAHLLVCAVSLNGLLMLGSSYSAVQAQERIIVVNADQPNLWTLGRTSVG